MTTFDGQNRPTTRLKSPTHTTQAPKPETFKIDAVPPEVDPLHARLLAARRFLIGSVRLRTD